MAYIFETDEVMRKALALFQTSGEYGLYTSYYKGDHAIMYATEKWRNIFGRIFRRFSDNLCPTVVDALADRLVIGGFGVKGQEGTTNKARLDHEDATQNQTRALKDLWEANRMDYNAGRVMMAAIRDGDSFVTVWPDVETLIPRIVPQPAAAMRVWYDQENPGKLLWAAKAWFTSAKRVRLNLYMPDRIEKWISQSKRDTIPERPNAMMPYTDEVRALVGDIPTGEEWPLKNPWGILPVFHFANNADLGECGTSDLKPVIPLQNALNKAVLDLMAGGEYVALPQRWATGIEFEMGADGKPISPFQTGVDQLWGIPAPDAKLGQFDQADLTKLLAVINDFRMEVARVSGTPLHYFGLITDPPSGEALKTLEARLSKKARDRMAGFGNVWEDIARLVYIQGGNDTNTYFTTEWSDPNPVSDKEKAETGLLKKQLGVSRKQCLREMGYTDEQIEEFEQERDEELQATGEQMLDAIARGEMDKAPTPSGFPKKG